MEEKGFTIGWENQLSLDQLLNLLYKYWIAEASYQEIYEDAYDLVNDGLIADSLADYIIETDVTELQGEQLDAWLAFKAKADADNE